MITPIALEYIICQLQHDRESIAVKSHRQSNRNPGLTINVTDSDAEWSLVGLAGGTVEPADPENPAATRLDFYVGKTALTAQRNMFPTAGVRPSARSVTLTNPTGTERRGGKSISWRGPIHKLPIERAEIFFPDGQLRAVTRGEAFLNVDWEPAMYPMPDGTRLQVHFGVEGDWRVSANRRKTIPRAEIIITRAEYATLLQVLNAIG